MGFMFSCSGLAVLAGPPIAGALQTNLGGEKGRDVAKVFMGLVLVIGSLGMMGGRVLKVGWGFNKKS